MTVRYFAVGRGGPTQALGNDVGNRLTFTCSRRSVEDKTGFRLDRENYFELAGIAGQDGMQLRGMDLRIESRGRWNRHGERRRSRIITRNPATVHVLGDLGRVPPVVVHRKLLKTELPEHRVAQDFPSRFVAHGISNGRLVSFAGLLVVQQCLRIDFRQLQQKISLHQLPQAKVGLVPIGSQRKRGPFTLTLSPQCSFLKTGRGRGDKNGSFHAHQLKGKSSSQESEKLLIQNGLSHDTFWKKELPDGHGREGGVGDGTHFGDRWSRSSPRSGASPSGNGSFAGRVCGE